MQQHILLMQKLTDRSTNTEYTFISTKQNRHYFFCVLPYHYTFLPRKAVFVIPGRCRALKRWGNGKSDSDKPVYNHLCWNSGKLYIKRGPNPGKSQYEHLTACNWAVPLNTPNRLSNSLLYETSLKFVPNAMSNGNGLPVLCSTMEYHVTWHIFSSAHLTLDM